jgi:hypothetical protein
LGATGCSTAVGQFAQQSIIRFPSQHFTLNSLIIALCMRAEVAATIVGRLKRPLVSPAPPSSPPLQNGIHREKTRFHAKRYSFWFRTDSEHIQWVQMQARHWVRLKER